jgi:hypothetical protein
MNIGMELRGGILASTLAVIASLVSAPAHAVIGSLDRVPAATLLLPYFETNLGDPNGTQTRFTVVNTDPAQQMSHVTLWTDMGVPTLAFDLYVGGRASVAVDLRLLFAEGILPQTSPNNFPAGPDSDTHTPVSACATTATYAGFPTPNTLTANQIAHLRAAHSGLASATFGNQCSGANHGDQQILRGYVTIDAANSCSSKFPSDAGYFGAGGTGVASDANVLFGTYTTIERGNNVTAASPLVAIEASSTNSATTASGSYTFYAGYVGAAATDNRESLGTIWQARTLDVSFFDPGTDLVVWRDPGFPHTAFTCNTVPSDFPRGQTYIVGFDEQERATILNNVNNYPNPPPPPIYPVPLIAQRVPASSMSPYQSGFVLLNLNLTLPGMPTTVQGGLQSYVGVRHQFNGVFGAELPATVDAELQSCSFCGF